MVIRLCIFFIKCVPPKLHEETRQTEVTVVTKKRKATLQLDSKFFYSHTLLYISYQKCPPKIQEDARQREVTVVTKKRKATLR